MTFRDLLSNDKFIILDGAMGTMLQKSGLKLGGLPEELNFTNPDLIEDIHRQYIAAGAQAVYANTFGANRNKLKNSKYSVDEVIKKAVDIAKKACAGTDVLVALDVGSLGRMLRPAGDMPVDEAYEMFSEVMKSGENAGADFIAIETMTDLTEAKTALLAAKENTSLPVICTMSFEKNLRTFTGCTAASAVLTLQGAGADAVGMSTAVEAVAARHCGMEVLGISCISNLAAGISPEKLSHKEVQETADKTAPMFRKLVTKAIEKVTAGK